MVEGGGAVTSPQNVLRLADCEKMQKSNLYGMLSETLPTRNEVISWCNDG